MESEVHSNNSALLFEPNDETLKQVLRSRIVSAIERLEDRVECDEDDIEFATELENNVEYLFAYITYKIVRYNTYYTSKIGIGEVSNE